MEDCSPANSCKLKGNSKPKGVSASQMPQLSTSEMLPNVITWLIDFSGSSGRVWLWNFTKLWCQVVRFQSPPVRTFSELYLEIYFSQQAHTSENYHALWTEACGFNFSLHGKIRVTAIKPSPGDNFIQKWPMYSKSMNSGSVNRAKISKKLLKWH